MHHHDLIVIGTGSGNSVIDDSFADLGHRAHRGAQDRRHLPELRLHPVEDAGLHGRRSPTPSPRPHDFDVDAKLRRDALARRARPGLRPHRPAFARRAERAARTPTTSPTTTATPSSPGRARADRHRRAGNRHEVSADRVVIAAGGGPSFRRWSPTPDCRTRRPTRSCGSTHHRAGWPSSAAATSPPNWRTSSPRRAARSPSSRRPTMLLGGPQDDEVRRTSSPI